MKKKKRERQRRVHKKIKHLAKDLCRLVPLCVVISFTEIFSACAVFVCQQSERRTGSLRFSVGIFSN